MADILIRGMEMPLSKTKLIVFPSGVVQVYDSRENYLGKAEAVPLPKGHGKLIDGHKLYRALFATECGNIAADRDSEGWPKVLTYEAVKKAIQDATIIVPAEGGKADGNS